MYIPITWSGQRVWIDAESGTPPLSDATTCDVSEKAGDNRVLIGADWDPRPVLGLKQLQWLGRELPGSRFQRRSTTSIDVPLTGRVWDGNLWGVTFAALPLREGGTYTLPFWQYDQGFGTFTAHVVGSELVETPTGKVEAWTVDAGTDPARLLRYRIAKAPRQELGYTAGEHAETIGGACS